MFANAAGKCDAIDATQRRRVGSDIFAASISERIERGLCVHITTARCILQVAHIGATTRQSQQAAAVIQQIIDVIQQHHGTSLVIYFFRRALQLQEDARQGGKIMNIREGDIPEVREESFRYGGPRPQSREAGIISLADAAESASRSLEKVTPQKLDQLISDIIEKRIQDRQLDECELTLRDLRIIADSFRFTLLNMLHSRIAYPGGQGAKAEGAAVRPQAVDSPPVSAA